MCWYTRTRRLVCSFFAVLVSTGCGGDVDPAPPTPFKTKEQIVCGVGKACMLHADGSATCWGQFANNDTPPGPFRALAAGTSACGLRPDNRVECWSWAFEPQTMPAEYFSEFRMSRQLACGIDLEGAPLCWAWTGGREHIDASPLESDLKEVHPGYCALRRSDSTPVCWIDPELIDAPAEPFVSLAVASAACGIRADGTLSCWGSPNNEINVPPTDGPFVSAKMELTSGCAERSDHTLSCWGSWRSGTPSPKDVFQDYCVENEWGCGILEDGRVTCWGEDSYGAVHPPPL